MLYNQLTIDKGKLEVILKLWTQKFLFVAPYTVIRIGRNMLNYLALNLPKILK